MFRHVRAGLLGLALLSGTAPSLAADTTKALAEDQKFDQQMRRWLQANPEVVLEALRKWEQQEKERIARENDDLIIRLDRELVDASAGPVVGKADAKVTIVYVLDAACTYCRRMVGELDKVMDDPDVRIIHRWVPFLTPASQYAAHAAYLISAHYGVRYHDFYSELMKQRDPLTNEIVDRVIGTVLGPDALVSIKAELAGTGSASYEAAVQANLALTHKAKIEGTPFFYVQGAGRAGIFRGAVPADKIVAAIAKAKADSKSQN